MDRSATLVIQMTERQTDREVSSFTTRRKCFREKDLKATLVIQMTDRQMVRQMDRQTKRTDRDVSSLTTKGYCFREKDRKATGDRRTNK